MKSILLLLFGTLVACAPQIDITLLSLAEASNPNVTLELVLTAGDRFATATLSNQPLPVLEHMTLPEGFELLPLHVEARAFVGEREVARGAVDMAAGEKEATIIFAVCSNGALELGEACEDGNLTDGDNCDSTCKPSGCASGVATVGELCFIDNDDLIGPASPLQVLSADLDGDALPDLVAPYSADGAVRIFNNQGAGGFGSFDSVSVPGVERLVLGDLDGDGDQDVLASVRRLNAVPGLVVLTNDGGIFSAGPEATLSALSVSDLKLGDINGDGLLDLVLTDNALSVVKVFLGEGAGRFGFQNQAPSVGFGPVALALADIDNDGDIDAVTANAGTNSGSFSVLENESGVLVAKLPVPLVGVPSALVIGNFIEDGFLEIVVSTQDGLESNINVFENKDIDGFKLVAPFPATELLSALAAADVDLDGDLDIVATSKTLSLIEVQFNKFGQFDAPRDASGGLFETRVGPVSLVATDLNIDGVPDLVTAGENLGLLLSNP
jgi:cysteine-rich repeat protein